MSLPLEYLSYDLVKNKEELIIDLLKKIDPRCRYIESNINVVPSKIDSNRLPVWCLGDRIGAMAYADLVVFSPGISVSAEREVHIEWEICRNYGITYTEESVLTREVY